MNNPKISIVMPAYNCEKYIDRAIKSIISQTYENWELIITEDCSTDNTFDIASKYESDRIHIYKTEKNSGTVYTPRLIAFNHAKGEYVINVDSDDYIESDYIQKCIQRIQETGADSCCGKMIMVDEYGQLLNIPTIPDSSFDFNQILEGREAFLLTVPRYRIAMNGFVSKKEIWEMAWSEYEKPGYRGIHEDENIGKLMLMHSSKVVFADAYHYYTINSKSVTHVFNDKVFDWVIANEDMLKFVKKYYGEGEEYRETELADYYAYVHATEFLGNSICHIDSPKLQHYFCEMKKWHNRINWNVVKDFDGQLKWIIGKNFTLRWIYKLMQHKAGRFLPYVMRVK